MNPHGHIEFLCQCPHRLHVGVVEQTAPHFFRVQKNGHKSQIVHSPSGFLKGHIDIVKRDARRPLQTLRVRLAEIGQPVVVRPGHGKSEIGLERIHGLRQHPAAAAIEHGEIDAFEIHAR